MNFRMSSNASPSNLSFESAVANRNRPAACQKVCRVCVGGHSVAGRPDDLITVQAQIAALLSPNTHPWSNILRMYFQTSLLNVFAFKNMLLMPVTTCVNWRRHLRTYAGLGVSFYSIP